MGEGRAILRLHYPTVRPDRQQRIVLLGERPQAPARFGGGYVRFVATAWFGGHGSYGFHCALPRPLPY